MVVKNKIYIILGIFALLLLIALACLIFLFMGVMQESKNLASGQEKLALLEKEFEDIESFKKSYDVYKEDLEKTDNLFIDSRNPVDFIEFLEATSEKHGLKLDVSVPSFSQEGTIVGSFQFSVVGSFSKIVEFINAIEKGPYLIQIKNFNIARNQELGKSQPVGQFKASFLIQVLAK